MRNYTKQQQNKISSLIENIHYDIIAIADECESNDIDFDECEFESEIEQIESDVNYYNDEPFIDCADTYESIVSRLEQLLDSLNEF